MLSLKVVWSCVFSSISLEFLLFLHCDLLIPISLVLVALFQVLEIIFYISYFTHIVQGVVSNPFGLSWDYFTCFKGFVGYRLLFVGVVLLLPTLFTLFLPTFLLVLARNNRKILKITVILYPSHKVGFWPFHPHSMILLLQLKRSLFWKLKVFGFYPLTKH